MDPGASASKRRLLLAIAGAGGISLDRHVAGILRQRRRDKEMVAALLAAENQMSLGEVRLPV